MNSELKLSRALHSFFTSTLALSALLTIAGCALRNGHTSDAPNASGSQPSYSSTGTVLLPNRVAFYTVPFR